MNAADRYGAPQSVLFLSPSNLSRTRHPFPRFAAVPDNASPAKAAAMGEEDEEGGVVPDLNAPTIKKARAV